MKEYLVIYERGPHSWGAYSPDVPGCIAVAKTREEVERNFQEALEFHLEGLQLEGLTIPESTFDAGRVAVAVAA